jgi:hypothetical protein
MPDRSWACRIFLACVFAAGLAACSARPFPVAAPESLTRALKEQQTGAAAAPDARRSRIVAICYNNLLNTPEEVLEEARYECRGGEVRFQDKDSFWTPCGLLQPVRASFLCTPRPEPAE